MSADFSAYTAFLEECFAGKPYTLQEVAGGRSYDIKMKVSCEGKDYIVKVIGGNSDEPCDRSRLAWYQALCRIQKEEPCVLGPVWYGWVNDRVVTVTEWIVGEQLNDAFDRDPSLMLPLGKKVGKLVWIGVVVALVGMFLLCIKDDFSVNIGDLFTLGCAFVFSFHIIIIDRYAGSMNSILLSATQFAVVAIAALPFMLFAEEIVAKDILSCWMSILYAGVCSGAMGYTLQMVGQRYTNPTLASLLMCLESVFAALGGWILLGESLSGRELLGCALMLGASVIAQLPENRKNA